jgi:tetratricopeptide (TPR) repeat protein
VGGLLAVTLGSLLVLWAVFALPRNSGIDRVVILPPELTGDPTTDGFLDGIHREIIYEIKNVPGLEAVSRSSAMAFRTRGQTISEFVRDVHADAALEIDGGVVGDSIQLAVALWDSQERHRWDSEFLEHSRNRLPKQVVLALAEATEKDLRPEQRSSLNRLGTESQEAYDAYLRGLDALDGSSPRDFGRATEWFQRSIDLDSTYAKPYAALSLTLTRSAMNYWVRPEEVAGQAERYAQRALNLDSNLAEGHLAMGLFLYRFEWDERRGEESLRRAIELNEQSGEGHRLLAQLLVFAGRADEAIPHARRSVEIDPLNYLPLATLTRALTFAGRFVEADSIRTQVEEDWPDQQSFKYIAAMNFCVMGRWEDAIESHREFIRDFEAASEQPVPLAFRAALGGTLAFGGHVEEAAEILTELLRGREAGEYVPSDAIAWVYISLGENEKAMEWLERAYEEGETGLIYLRLFFFNPIREDPRFQEFFGKVLGESG